MSIDFIKVLKKAEIAISMDRKSVAWRNTDFNARFQRTVIM